MCTSRLAKRAAKVVSIEVDERLPPLLAETMAGVDNFKLVLGRVEGGPKYRNGVTKSWKKARQRLLLAKKSFNVDTEMIRGMGGLAMHALKLYYESPESAEGR